MPRNNKKPGHLTYDQWVEDRFWSKIKIDQESGCWVWIGAKSRGGRSSKLSWGKEYGTFRVLGRSIRVHRWSYERYSGKTLPPKMEAHHFKCFRTLCANWTHIEPRTKQENASEARKRKIAGSKEK